MKLVFTYNIEKDIENIISGAKSINNKKPTRFYNLLTEKYGEHLNTEQIKAFIEEQDARTIIDMDKEVANIEKRWKIIEPVFIDRVEKMFETSYPAPIITVYVTHNERCTYNIEKNYFFVKNGSEFSNNTILHELLHFYTWHAFGKKLLQEGLSVLAYNDIKESLTELLNLEFSDLMNGKSDDGYPQHQEMRAKIKELWLTERKLSLLIEKLVSASRT